MRAVQIDLLQDWPSLGFDSYFTEWRGFFHGQLEETEEWKLVKNAEVVWKQEGEVH